MDLTNTAEHREEHRGEAVLRTWLLHTGATTEGADGTGVHRLELTEGKTYPFPGKSLHHPGPQLLSNGEAGLRNPGPDAGSFLLRWAGCLVTSTSELKVHFPHLENNGE